MKTPWAMTTRLTLYYTVAIFLLLSAASAFLYWELKKNLEQENRDYLHQKMQVLTDVLKIQPLNRIGVEQEVREEAEISAQSQSPFFLRVLNSNNRVLVETVGMSRFLPELAFPAGPASIPQQRRWRTADHLDFLLASADVLGVSPEAARWRVQAAINISAEQALLGRYRSDIAVVLLTGLMFAALLGLVITRRGLRPIADITHAAERIGVQQLRERIKTGAW